MISCISGQFSLIQFRNSHVDYKETSTNVRNLKKQIIRRFAPETRQLFNKGSGLYFLADTEVSNLLIRTFLKQQCSFLYPDYTKVLHKV